MRIFSHRLAPTLALSLLLAASAALHAETTEPAGAATSGLPAITVSKVVEMQLQDVVLGSGQIGPVEQVLVQPQIEGQAIDAIMVEIGDKVEQGQVLARLSDSSLILQKSQLQASLAASDAAIAQAQAQVIEAQTASDEAIRLSTRTKALAAAGTSTKSAADTAQANATAAAARVTVAAQGLIAAEAQRELVEAQVANIDLSLQRTNVSAPVAGEVVGKNAMVGAIASGAAGPMFTLNRGGLLELRADVDEQDVLRLVAGQRAVLWVSRREEPLTGSVRLVEPTVDQATRLGRVRISIDDPEQVRAGMFADTRVLLQSKTAVAVPVSAVGGGADGATALKVVEGTVTLVAITTGIRDGGMIEVTSGLSAGDLIVTKAGAFVRDGDHINPVMAAGAEGSN